LRSTLGQRLVALFFVFSVAPLLSMNVHGYLQSRASLTEQAERSLSDVAALEASQTLVFVDTQRDLVPLLVAGNLHLFGLLRSLQTQQDPQILEALHGALRKLLQRKVAEDADAQEFYVLAPDGALMASSLDGHPFREDRSTEACLREGGTGPRIVGFEYPGDRPTLVVAAPVADEFGTSWGVFCGRFAFNQHEQLVAARDGRTAAGSVYLVDPTGHVVDAAVSAGSASVAHGALLRRPASLVSGTPAWASRYQLDSGEEVLAAWAPVPQLGWGVLVEVPVANALANLTELKWQAVVLGSLLTVLLVTMALLAAGGISRPLAQLSAGAQRVADGLLGEQVPVDGPREVVELAAAFNRMSLKLRESHQLLEARVAEATRDLRQANEFSELLLNSIDQRVVVVDPSLRIIKANGVALKAWGADLVGQACDVAVPGGVTLCDAAAVRRTLETGEPTTTERFEALGEVHDIVRIDTLRVTEVEGTVDAVVVVGRVVTAEKRLQAELEKMAAFGRLAAGVAHEAGNPLACVAAQLRMNRDAVEPERVRKTFTVVEKEVDRVTRLLRELMTFARRRRDDVTLVQLNDIVGDVTRLVAHDERTRQVRIETRVAPGLPGVRVKEDHLTQVLLNLTLNAIDAMGGSGTLTIETAAADGVVTCRVCDTGSGIAPEVRSRVFEAFFTTKEAGRGTGLGLFVSRNLVAGLGGTLQIERTSSEGTVFLVTLPVGGAPSAST
jgi:C4-dicarboxylate-specific signal transduction histidine kinase